MCYQYPTVDLALKVVGVGNTTGLKVDKFKKFNFTQESATYVKVPMISECFANLECKVINTKMSFKYNVFILECLKAWVSHSKKRHLTIHHCGNGIFTVDGRVLKISSKKK